MQVTKSFLTKKLLEVQKLYEEYDDLYYRKIQELEEVEKQYISLKNTVSSIDASRKDYGLDMENYQDMLAELEANENKE